MVTLNFPLVIGLVSLSTTVTLIVTLPTVLFSNAMLVFVGILFTVKFVLLLIGAMVELPL